MNGIEIVKPWANGSPSDGKTIIRLLVHRDSEDNTCLELRRIRGRKRRCLWFRDLVNEQHANFAGCVLCNTDSDKYD